MKKLFTYVLMLCASLSVSVAQQIQYPEPILNPESCTSIMVGKKASADGSVMTSHTCDSNYRTWMDIVPSASYDHDTTTTVYTGRMHTEYDEGTRGMIAKGTLPEARSTYQFLNTAYPCLNEKQLGIGETTITGRKALVNKKGMFMIEELQRIVLQRCTTARDAIRVMGELIEKYGYGDWGECLTIADPKEVWHFEVFGEGPDKIGGVWAAIRIPDDHVGVSANIPRISKVDPKDTDNCMASANVFEVAKRMGFWDGKKPFRFWEAYGGGNYSGEMKSFSIREFFILNKLAPSLRLSYDAEELPISVKPDRQVSVTDVMALLSETYEGTEYDMTQNLKVAVKKKDSNETDPVFLTYDELQTLMKKKFTIPRLELVRDIFVFACFTGLAFSDVATLSGENLVQDNLGDWWIRKGRVKLEHRRKASSISNIPLLPVPLAILEKYREHPVCIKKGCCLPVMCNQKMNSYLKEIADFCGIKKNLTTHVARHTFGTTVTLANNVPLQDVSVMLGHASTRMTQHYARVMNSSLKEAMNNVKERLAQ